MRKRRADSKLFSLPEKAQRDIYRMAEGTTLTEAVAQLALPEEMGGYEVEVSESSLSNFCAQWRGREFRDRLHASATASQEVDDALTDEQRATMDQAIIDGLKQWTFDSILNQVITPKDAKSLMGVILKDRAMDLDERKLSLLERKAEAFDALEKAADTPGGLTPETLSQIREKAGLL